METYLWFPFLYIQEFLMENNTQVKIPQQSFDRIMYFDYLRILATIAVMVIHIAAEKILEPSVYSYDFNMLNIWDSLARWSVPMFAMLSGALFLDNSIPMTLKSVFKQNILRIITAFCFWSAFYVADYTITYGGLDIKGAALMFCQGHYHMWFLFMIVGLYLIVPIMRKITESEYLTKYFVILSLVFTFIIPTILRIPPFTLAQAGYGYLQFNLTRGYVCYFVMGYWLHKTEICKKMRWIIYILGISGFAATILLTAFESRKTGAFYANYYDYFTLNVMLEAVGLFVFAKYVLSKIKLNNIMNKLIVKLSLLSFGAYLIHAFVIEKLALLGLNSLSFNPALAVPAITVLVFVASMVVSAVISKIPVLKKYIV